MTRLLLILLLAFPPLAMFAQDVSGSVQDPQNRPLAGATISVLKPKDSSLVKYSSTNNKGEFLIQGIPSGQYMISVTAVGLKPFFSPVHSFDAPVKLGMISMQASEKELASITVTAKKPLIEHKADRLIVNVDASPSNSGTNILEVLEKSPGIMVDKDGNISLKGKAGVVVLMDGRPTQLSGADLANLLRNQSSNNIDQIEIMTNPPARFDASGNAGVINIKTKKLRQMGYNGSVTLGYGQGIYPKFNEGLTFNYRHNKVNLFTSLSHNYREGVSHLNIQRNFLDQASKEIKSSFDQKARMDRLNQGFNGNLGMDYFLDQKTTIGFVASGYSSTTEQVNSNNTLIYNAANVLSDRTRSVVKGEESWKNYSLNINGRRQLDSTGKELTADLDYSRYDADAFQQLTNAYYNADGHASRRFDTLHTVLPQDIHIYSGKMDFSAPGKNGSRFEAGIKSSYVISDSRAMYDTIHNEVSHRDLGRTNDFVYRENINAAYVSFNASAGKKWNFQGGLRVENTIASGRSTGFVFNPASSQFVPFDSSFKRNYTQLFPTAYIQYKVTDNDVLVLNYGRRIRRPDYGSLNPFIEYIDRYTYEQGNPMLKPQFSNNFELSYSYKSFLTFQVNYTHTYDILQNVLEQNETTNETYMKRANIATMKQWGAAIILNKPVTKWWTTNFYINGFRNHFVGVVNTEPISFAAVSVSMNATQSFKLSAKTGFELSGWWRSGAVEGVLVTRPMGAMALGFSHQIMKGKGTLRLNVRDIFYTQIFSASSKYGTVDAAFQQNQDSRVVNLSFSYRFNKGKVSTPKKRNTGSASDEQSRVGQGG